MNRWSIAVLYGALMSLIFIIDLLATQSISKYKITNRVNYDVYIGDINLLLNTKILLIIDVYFFSVFYLENNLNAIYQNILIKITSIGIWVILACRFRFAADIICFIAVKVISIFFLMRSASLMEDLIYIRFNKTIGVDAKMIYKYLLFEIIIALKYLAMIFECLTMFIALSLEHGIGQKPFSIVKLTVFVFDIFLRRQNMSHKRYLLITTPLFLLPFIYGMIVIGGWFIKDTVQNNMVFVFNRIFNLCIILVSLFALTKVNK